MVKKQSLEELLNELNKKERDKFEYLLNFFSADHVLYNFSSIAHEVQDISFFTKAEFQKPAQENLKRLLDNIELREILSVLDNISTAGLSNQSKATQDLLIYLVSYTDKKDTKIEQIVYDNKEYHKIINSGLMTEAEIYSLIRSCFDNKIQSGNKLDLDEIEDDINRKILEKLPIDYEHRKDFEKEEYTFNSSTVSECILEKLNDEDIKEAFNFQGNVRTKDMRILAIKAILGNRFSSLDYKLCERLKAMLSDFKISKMTESDLELFIQNIDGVINKGFGIEDIYYVKNIVGNESALRAFANLPENLQNEFLRVNVIAKPEEAEKVLEALSFCKNPKMQTETKSKLGISSNITFGFELEVSGLSSKVLEEIVRRKDLFNKIKDNQNAKTSISGWKIDYDGTVPDGLELISPVLHDDENDWTSLKEKCEILQALGTETNHRCGGHIHIGTDILGTNEDAWKSFFSLWSLSEGLLYKISNKPGEEPRNTSQCEFSPTKPIIDEMLENDSIKINNYDDIRILADEYTRRYLEGYSSSGRGKGLNLQCIAEGKQNTIEFRIPNGNIDFVELQRTAELYARMLQISREVAENPNYKKETFRKLETASNEDEKLVNFLDLIFDDMQSKLTFYERFYSQDKGLVLAGTDYEDIIKKDVEVNRAARYEWRGTR